MSIRRAIAFVVLGVGVALALLVAGASTTTPIDFGVGESAPNRFDPTPHSLPPIR